MKKLILLILVIALGAGVYFLLLNKPEKVENNTPASTETSGSLKPDPSNATFTFDGESVKLLNGKNEMPTEPGSVFTEETNLLDKFAYGDINGDGKTDTVLFITRSGGGSGTFIYVAGYFSGPVNYKGSEAFFFGDRVAPQSVSIAQGTITVNYLDRGPNDPFSSEPTIPTTKTLTFRNGEFVER